MFSIPFFILQVLLPGAHAADGPQRCEAVFTGPTELCELKEPLQASGAGRTAEQARSHTLQRLSEAATTAARLRADAARGTLSEDRARQMTATCGPEVAEKAEIFCFPDDFLAEKALCVVSFTDPACWRGGELALVGRAWRVSEAGRIQMCEEVDQGLATWDAGPERRLACQLQCLQQSRVVCSTDLKD